MMSKFLPLISLIAVAGVCVQYSWAHDGSQEVTLNRLDLVELSKVQRESRLWSPERRCDLFEAKLRSMLGDNNINRLHLFEQVVGVLSMRELPFNNDQPALTAIRQCVDDLRRSSAAATTNPAVVVGDGIRREVIAPPSPVHGPELPKYISNEADPLAHSIREFKGVKENVKDFGQDIYLAKNRPNAVVGGEQHHKSVYDEFEGQHHQMDAHPGDNSHTTETIVKPVTVGAGHAIDQQHMPEVEPYEHDQQRHEEQYDSHDIHVENHHSKQEMELHNDNFGHDSPARNNEEHLTNLNKYFEAKHGNDHDSTHHDHTYNEERPFEQHQTKAAMVAEFINDEIFDELVRKEKDPVRKLKLLLENEKKLTSWLRKQLDNGQYEVAELREKLTELQVALDGESNHANSSFGSDSVNNGVHHHLDSIERARLQELERLYEQSLAREAHLEKELRSAMARISELLSQAGALKQYGAHHVDHDDSDSDDDDDNDDDDYDYKKFIGHNKKGHKNLKKNHKKDSKDIEDPVVMAYKLQDRFKSNDNLSTRCQKYYMLFTYPSEVNKKVIKTIARLSLGEFTVTSSGKYHETLNRYANLLAQSAIKKSRHAAKELAECAGLHQPVAQQQQQHHHQQEHYSQSLPHQMPSHHVVSSSPDSSHGSYFHQSPPAPGHPWSYSISRATAGGSSAAAASASASASSGGGGLPRFRQIPRKSRF